MKDYQQLLNELVNGELKELVIERDDFIAFRNIWQNHPEKDKIIGEARLGGSVIYTYKDAITEA